MPDPFTKIGGVNIGVMNASWPLAKLKVSAEKIELSALFLGTYAFLPEDVISIEPYSLIPFLGSGVQIHHARTDCSKRVIFYHPDGPARLIEQIQNAGFECRSGAAKVGGDVFDFPVKSWVIASIVIVPMIVGAIMMIAYPHPPQPSPADMIYISLAIQLAAAMLLLCLLKSSTLQKLIMKPARHFGEIHYPIQFMAVCLGSSSVILAVVACFV